MAVRYVDDVIMGSADSCRNCLTSVLQAAYPKGVQFDVAEPAAGDSDHRVQVDWLDLTVSLLQQASSRCSQKSTSRSGPVAELRQWGSTRYHRMSGLQESIWLSCEA